MSKQRRHVTLVGCGGVGGWVARILAPTHRLALIDGDRVEKKNLDRQFFLPEHEGMLKVEALRRGIECLPGAAPIEHCMDEYLTPGKRPRWPTDCIMCCADNHRAQATCLQLADTESVPAIVCANESLSASAYLYLFHFADGERDMRVRFPQISIDNMAGDPTIPHCQVAVASGQQSVYANMAAALLGVSLLYTWVDSGFCDVPEFDDTLVGIAWRHECQVSKWRSIS